MRVWHVILLAIVLGTGVPIALHHQQWGVFNLHHSALAFFLWLNFIIAVWELCLFAKRDLIAQQHRQFVAQYQGRELERVRDFMMTPAPPARVFSPSLWAELWSSYSVFDESYANRRSFGFWIDTGNGFSTLIPTLLVLYGMTYRIMPARLLGIVGVLLFYQMWYGTVVYFASYLSNKRYVGHSALNIAVFVGASNGLWLSFPIWGMYASIVLIYSDSYALFVG